MTELNVVDDSEANLPEFDDIETADSTPPTDNDNPSDAASSGVGKLRNQSIARQQRLRQMRLTIAGESGEDDFTLDSGLDSLPPPIFRNYQPELDLDQAITIPAPDQTDLSKFLSNQSEPTDGTTLVEEVNLMNLAPRKPDWDLKRGVEKKLAKLDRRTQRVIAEIIRERYQNSQADLADAVGQQLTSN